MPTIREMLTAHKREMRAAASRRRRARRRYEAALSSSAPSDVVEAAAQDWRSAVADERDLRGFADMLEGAA